MPEPIVKQIIWEQTGQRDIAERISVVQYENKEVYQQAAPILTANDFLIDMDTIFGGYISK